VILAVAVLALIAGAAFYRSRQNSVRTVRTAKVERQDIRASIVTNGKAEPLVYREVRAELEGEVAQVLAREGDKVRGGQKLVELSQPQTMAEREQARAELAEAENALRLLRQGGTTAQISELRAQLDLARREREEAAKLVAQNERWVERGAVARVELEQSRTRLAKAESDLSVLEEKWQRRSDPEELARAEARVQAARATLNLAEFRIRSATVVAPHDGVVYSIAVRIGDHVNRGDVLARVGDVARIRVRVFVDEPDLGRVAMGQIVLLRWDGLPSREWKGAVERLPAEVKELESRTVGEVACTVENPSGELLPNMNLNVEIVTESKSAVLVVPREAVTGRGADQAVFVVRDGVLVRQAVQTGILSPTRAEIVQGVSEGDVVALAGDVALEEGMRVRQEQ
jgi:multidrug efflux pump subunit AcrA (membrane-fusion protein)